MFDLIVFGPDIEKDFEVRSMIPDVWGNCFDAGRQTLSFEART